jgi:Protein of unknown function (DUF2794)
MLKEKWTSVENTVDNTGQNEAAANLVRFPGKTGRPVAFDRRELSQIFDLYGRNVASGEWRDYAMDFSREAATFSIFRRSSEQPLYRIVKNPDLARKQGMYAVVAQGGLILKRGADLAQVLRVLLKRPKLAGA